MDLWLKGSLTNHNSKRSAVYWGLLNGTLTIDFSAKVTRMQNKTGVY